MHIQAISHQKHTPDQIGALEISTKDLPVSLPNVHHCGIIIPSNNEVPNTHPKKGDLGTSN